MRSGEPEERRPMTDQPEDEPTSIEHRQLSAIAAAMRRLSQDGGAVPKPVGRHRAGRDVHLSLKVSAGVKEQFRVLAAAHGLAFGELLERALDAFVRKAKRW
jgi:hypothetical protein